MKERILSSAPIKWLRELAITKWLLRFPLFQKMLTYEIITYLIAGVLTTIVNYVVYFIMPRFESNGVDIILANAVAWICAVLFAYVVNKIFVFDSPSWSRATLKKEFIPFVTCRLLSFLIETAFLYLTVSMLHLNEPLFKILANVFVLIANYAASKLIIFKK